MGGTVKVVEMTINGVPYTCPECDSRSFTLDGGRIDAFPADANCFYSHYWTDPLITSGTLTMILGSRTGRTKATHEDTFTVTVGGARLQGTLVPEIVYDDVKQAGRVYWRRIIKPAARQKKRAVIRAAKKPGKQAAKKARAAANSTAASAKSAVLTAAWTAQAGSYEADPDYTPEPINLCGAGCSNGYFAIDTRIHGMTKVRCTACRGTGQVL